jgi:hypothetical protein
MSTAMWLDTTSWMRGSAEALKELTELADIPESQWPGEIASKMRAAPPITSETAAQRLIRWRSFFVSELADLERAVVVSPVGEVAP